MKTRKEPKYNGWIVFVLVIMVLGCDDWLLIASVLLCIIYAGIIEYLKLKYNTCLSKGKK